MLRDFSSDAISGGRRCSVGILLLVGAGGFRIDDSMIPCEARDCVIPMQLRALSPVQNRVGEALA
jgi:hypothetical protein